MAARDLVPTLQAAVEGFNTVVDGKQPTLDAKLPTAQTALDGARESRNGALVARDATNLSRDAAYRDFRSAKANLDHQDLIALAASKAVNAVDVFIYDTCKDSDGGAWRKRCAKTSWFNEPLNTATRGARRDFPAVAVIVAEADAITIYDGDDPSLPLWAEYSFRNAPESRLWWRLPGASSLAAKNGKLCFGLKDGLLSSNGLAWLDFVADVRGRKSDVTNIQGEDASSGKSSAENLPIVGSDFIVAGPVNDVAMTVLPDAPVDPATGLPVPTIAVATDGGVSVIKDDGSVVDSADPGNQFYVSFDPSGRLYFLRIGAGDRIFSTSVYAADGFTGDANYWVNGLTKRKPALLAVSGMSEFEFEDVNNGGFVRVAENTSDFNQYMQTQTTSSYANGWLPGDIRGAFLADTDATELVGGTDADRSIQNNPLTVNGTITRAPVAPGAELVAYSGFSASNYLEQPYNPDLDFGTGDFCIMGWMPSFAGVGTATGFLDRANDVDATGRFSPRLNSDETITLYRDSGNIALLTPIPSGDVFLAFVRRSGVLEYYINGDLVQSTAMADTLTSPDAKLRIGTPIAAWAPFPGQLALWRLSATAPTADQIAKIYNDEKVLFQENAACTLYGASDAVTALAHDPDTGLLHVGTSAGRSVFKGLRRVDNTTQPVTTAISAANGMVIEQ